MNEFKLLKMKFSRETCEESDTEFRAAYKSRLLIVYNEFQKFDLSPKRKFSFI